MANPSAVSLYALISVISLMHLVPAIHGWGLDGHYTVCKIAESRLSDAATKAVKELLPKSAGGDLAKLCIWPDRIRFRYHWSAPLHYIDTPDKACTYQFNRDCKDEAGRQGRCVAGAINNYTTQLQTYKTSSLAQSQYNLSEALLFLSHFMGRYSSGVTQPLHVGFTSDRGANKVSVHWYRRKTNLHHTWDTNIIEKAEQQFYGSSVDKMIEAIKRNITTGWAQQVKQWESCGSSKTCPDIYAGEGIKAACEWAYKGVTDGATLDDAYFYSRVPIVTWRLAQAGVRLAASLNAIFR